MEARGMKLFLYIIGGAAVTGLVFWLITTSNGPANSLLTFSLVTLCAASPLGAFWMAYMAIRYEKDPWPMVLLGLFVPFAFLWYYFERVKPGRLPSRPYHTHAD
jgi:hypothetical protein